MKMKLFKKTLENIGIKAAYEERFKLVKATEDKRVICDWKQGKDELSLWEG